MCYSFDQQAHGDHSNDVESENARMKSWLRSRYTKLVMTAVDEFHDVDGGSVWYATHMRDLYEYVFYVNESQTMMGVMKGLRDGANTA